MRPIIFIPLYFSCTILAAQVSRDSILASERAIDRPLTLHKGQIRMEAGYGFSAITKSFDLNGDAIKLREEGISYVRHAWIADARYGILENLQVGVSTIHKTQSQRKQQVVMTGVGGVTQLSEILNKTGFDDVLFTVTGRAPFTSKKIDILATLGFYVPVSIGKYDEPTHSIENADVKEVIYEYNSRWGRGTSVATIGGNFKYRLKSYAFTGTLNYAYPLSTSENVHWFHQTTSNDEFVYRKLQYAYQAPIHFSAAVEAERQLAPWFDLSILLSFDKSTGGWSEFTGLKLKEPGADFLSINPGYEILVTPKLWLRQRIFFGVLGKSTEVPFAINTSLIYNFIPF